MPYCDNNHVEEGLNTEKDNERVENKWKSYTGDCITVHFNLGLCSHVGYCIELLPSVFNLEAKPWINANGASVEEIIEIVKKCPSGALTYTKDGEYIADFDTDIIVTLPTKGPITVRGKVDLVDDLDCIKELAAKKRYTLCSCGHSKNHPFCDGSHLD